MYEFKRSLTALTGVVILVGIATITRPLTGRGASGTGSSAPTSQTQNVNVVNTPTVNAQQSGTWNVGINGTPVVGLDAGNNTVKVDTSNPLPVRDVENPANHPFAFLRTTHWNDFNFHPVLSIQVPANQRLVIEQVSVHAFMFTNGSQSVRVEVQTQTGGNYTSYFIPGINFEPLGPSAAGFIASSQLRMYADPETQVTISLYRNVNGGLDDYAEVGVSGHFVSVP